MARKSKKRRKDRDGERRGIPAPRPVFERLRAAEGRRSRSAVRPDQLRRENIGPDPSSGLGTVIARREVPLSKTGAARGLDSAKPVQRSACKERPKRNSGNGRSRAYVPWCSGKK